jgi:hypothetical protein
MLSSENTLFNKIKKNKSSFKIERREKQSEDKWKKTPI